MKKQKIILFLISVVVLSVIIGYNYMYKDHRDISSEEASFNTTADLLIKEYASDIDTSVKKYLDKTIQVKGKVTEIEQGSFTINNAIVCYTDSIIIKQIKNNFEILVKGRNIGYDEILDLIKLDQVTIINN